ncbi:hypothetical protein [Hymenobacter persicinus]|uniref:Uncharacterized protein n=1 Tax=Hymenobacter persicinus TaxID=2025506 RepID=A0A4V1ZAK1_9BACT|nr:hypothetical protein [Hymenobacter persicinus]RYU78468.1 hypothetical protein EWM57_13765 [Hymenobacter persicinus]
MTSSTSSTAPMPAGRVTLYHREHAQRQRKKSVGHVVPAVVLVFTALDALTGREPLSWVTGAEFVVGAAYLGLMLREWRHLKQRPFHHERVAWLELAAAGVLALEGYHIWHRHHEAELLSGVHKVHVLPFLYGTLAAFFVVLAFNLHRVGQRRHLHLHEEGFSGRLRLLGPAFHVRWADVTAVEPVGAADLLVHHESGAAQRISFADLHDGPAHRDRVVAHAAARLRGSE